jgi:hypothetical protein
MQTYPLVAAEYLVMGACAAFAFKQGGRAEQLGATWFALNLAANIFTSVLGRDSPVVHLVEDGVFAVGLLPMAMIFVSYWIGLVTLIAAALFSLEALYLLNDWSADLTYAWVNNCLWLAVPLVFLSAGWTNFLRHRREARLLRQAATQATDPTGALAAR